MASAPMLTYYTTGSRLLEMSLQVQGAMRKTELGDWIERAEESMKWATDAAPFYAINFRRRWHIFEKGMPDPKVTTRSRAAVEMWLMHRGAAHG